MGCVLAVTVAVRRQEKRSVPHCLGCASHCLRRKVGQQNIGSFVFLEIFPSVLSAHLTGQPWSKSF